MAVTETSIAAEKRKTVDMPSEEPEPKRQELSAPDPNPQLLPGPSTAVTQKRHLDLLSWPIERLATSVNQKFLDTIIQDGVGGYQVPDGQLVPTARVYTIEIKTLRDQFTSVLNKLLIVKFVERGDRTITSATALALKVSKLCAEVCMSAIYAKHQTLHRHIGTYKGRYTAPNTYSKEIELPLPFAIAIESFGLFETSAMTTRYSVFPVYPESNKFEGRSTGEINLLEYGAYCSLFAEIGLPMKNIDPRDRKGSAWWTYLPTYDGDSYDLKIPYPPLHYSDHSAVIASMFLSHNAETKKAKPIILPLTGEEDYGWHLKDIREGDQERAFTALCQWPDYYWN